MTRCVPARLPPASTHLGTDRTIETTTSPAQRLVTHARSLERALPADFLARYRGGPRGFWARADRWVAHAGRVACIRIDGEDENRFGAVRRAAARLAEGALPEGLGEGAEPPRFYGGFSFREDHGISDLAAARNGEEVWAAFPSALFHLPAVELARGGSGSIRLRVRASLGRGEDVEEVRAHLAEVADAVERSLSVEEAGAKADTGPGRSVVARRETERDAWEAAVARALDAVARGRLTKAVLARTLDLTLDEPVDPARIALALWGQSRGTHAFFFEPEPGRCLVGAAPEAVASVREGLFHATAVAGSIRCGRNADERERSAEKLLGSRKDREEQRMVVEDMARRLAPLAEEVRVQAEPHVLTLARIQHLETVIRARIPADRHVLDLLRALHPTPAVCGVPRDASLDFLRRHEPFERGWYSGPVGWFDTDGDGIFVPALRTAAVRGPRWRLFAGAGVVDGSDPPGEWDETGIKFEPVLRALEASGVRLS